MYFKKEETVSQLTHKCLKLHCKHCRLDDFPLTPASDLAPCPPVLAPAQLLLIMLQRKLQLLTKVNKLDEFWSQFSISKRKTHFLREDNSSSQGSPLLKLGAVSKFRIVLYTVSSSALPSPSLTSDFEKDFYLSAKSQLTSPPRESPLFLQEETWTTTKIIFNYTVTCRYKFHFPT